MDGTTIASGTVDPPGTVTVWDHGAVAAAATACGAVGVFLAILLTSLAASAGTGLEAFAALPWLVLVAFAAYGALWARPWRTAGFVWVGLQGVLMLGAAVTGTPGGWGPFVWYATASGFVAGFGAFVGSWLRRTVTSLLQGDGVGPVAP